MVTFAGALKDVNVGIALAVAVAIHNIPEGIAVAVPVYAATKSPSKAFLWSFLSGISEPIGALIAGLILLPFLNGFVLGFMLPLVAGFMVFISLDETSSRGSFLRAGTYSHSRGHSRHGCHGFESLDAFTVKRRVFQSSPEPHPWEARRR